MSLAVLTDSTTAQASPAFNCRPTLGNSTNTTSVNSCWAWSVMPMVAVSSLTRTHSCVFAYFKSAGMFAMVRLSQGKPVWSNRFSIQRFGCHHRVGPLAANFDGDGHLRLGKFRFHVAHANPNSQGRALRAARHFADLRRPFSGTPDGIMRTRRRRPI